MGIEPKRRHQPKLLKTHCFFHRPVADLLLKTSMISSPWRSSRPLRQQSTCLMISGSYERVARNPAKRQGNRIVKAGLMGAPSNTTLIYCNPRANLVPTSKKKLQVYEIIKKKNFVKICKDTTH